MAYNTKEDEEFFAAIGRLTISWAHIEAGLDFGIEVAHALGGSKIASQAPKTALNRKLKYLRKWCLTIAEPTFQRATLKMLDDIEAQSERRHDLIHGFMVSQAEGTGEAEMVRIVHHERPYGQKRYKVRTTDILTAAVAADKLSSRALRFGTGLQDLVETLMARPAEGSQ